MNGYMTAMRRYFDFSGRSNRSEFWFYVLIYAIIYIVAMVIDIALLGQSRVMQGGIGILTAIVGIVHLIPGLAVSVRRLHDTDRSGWWILIAFIPLIGAIWLIVLYCFEGTLGGNRFGPRPA